MSTNGGNTEGPRSSVGFLLEGIRCRRGLSLQEAAQLTGVPVRRLAGLENGDLSSLADADYLNLLLRVYADSLGLDGADLSRLKIELSPIVQARGVFKSYRAEELTVRA